MYAAIVALHKWTLPRNNINVVSPVHNANPHASTFVQQAQININYLSYRLISTWILYTTIEISQKSVITLDKKACHVNVTIRKPDKIRCARTWLIMYENERGEWQWLRQTPRDSHKTSVLEMSQLAQHTSLLQSNLDISSHCNHYYYWYCC